MLGCGSSIGAAYHFQKKSKRKKRTIFVFLYQRNRSMYLSFIIIFNLVSFLISFGNTLCCALFSFLFFSRSKCLNCLHVVNKTLYAERFYVSLLQDLNVKKFSAFNRKFPAYIKETKKTLGVRNFLRYVLSGLNDVFEKQNFVLRVFNAIGAANFAAQN